MSKRQRATALANTEPDLDLDLRAQLKQARKENKRLQDTTDQLNQNMKLQNRMISDLQAAVKELGGKPKSFRPDALSDNEETTQQFTRGASSAGLERADEEDSDMENAEDEVQPQAPLHTEQPQATTEGEHVAAGEERWQQVQPRTKIKKVQVVSDSSLGGAWQTQKVTIQPPEIPLSLRPQDWDVKIVKLGELLLSESDGVCVATREEALKAVDRRHPGRAAMVCFQPLVVKNKQAGTEIIVTCMQADRAVRRKAWLINLGGRPVQQVSGQTILKIDGTSHLVKLSFQKTMHPLDNGMQRLEEHPANSSKHGCRRGSETCEDPTSSSSSAVAPGALGPSLACFEYRFETC